LYDPRPTDFAGLKQTLPTTAEGDNGMNALKWIVVAFLTASPLALQAFGLEDAASGMAESAAKRAATSAARDAVNTVFEEEDKGDGKKNGNGQSGNKKKGKANSKTKKKGQ
jgi:hypothetical protein